jgi:hypothetical protein
VPIANARHADCEEFQQMGKAAKTKLLTPTDLGGETVDLLEEMLFQRAASGIRPVLYLSSYTDLECSVLMLLDDTGEARWSTEQAPVSRQVGYHIITN